MNKKQICQQLNISPATLDNWIKNHIPEAKVGSKYDFEIIQDFIVSNSKLQKMANKKLSSVIENNPQLLSYLEDDSWVSNWCRIVETNSNINLEDIINNIALKRVGKEFENSIELEIFSSYIPNSLFSLGVAYQIAVNAGNKSGKGSYYTPKWLIEKRLNKCLSYDISFLDPSVGCGFYPVLFATMYFDKYGEWPLKGIHINDVDPVAVNVAFSELISAGVPESVITISQVNGLSIDTNKKFDLIATNPPYGIKNEYPELKTTEIFAHFIYHCFNNYLKNNGTLDFILPSSLLNIKKHDEIRRFILQDTNIREIVFEGKCFDNVYSDIISITLKKECIDDSFSFIMKGQDKKVSQKYCFNSSHSIIVFVDNNDIEDQRFLLSIPHIYLGEAIFSLGIVTGNNKDFLSDNQLDGYNFIIDGKCVNQGFIDDSKGKWILNEPERYQQKPNMNLFNRKKIVYKFISNKLITAVDDNQRLTLNSANFLILPENTGLSEEYVSAILNSSIINEYYQIIFGNPIKVLKSSIQKVPIFVFDYEKRKKIEDCYLKGEFDKCDELITYFIDKEIK